MGRCGAVVGGMIRVIPFTGKKKESALVFTMMDPGPVTMMFL